MSGVIGGVIGAFVAFSLARPAPSRAPATRSAEPVDASQLLDGKFERRVKMPDGVDPEAITANLDDGVLSLIVPKPERLKPHTIAIGSGTQRELETTTA